MSRAVLREGGQVFPSAPWFYTGTHMPNWLWDGQMSTPLCVSQRTLADYGYFAFKPATVPWILDSGGFSELALYGEWRLAAEVYCGIVADLVRHVGGLDWAAPQDWMCEPEMIGGGVINGHRVPGTHLSVYEHQLRTVASFINLCELWPQYSRQPCPFIPVLQGWEPADYDVCAALYHAAGVDLSRYRIVGLGSVCRRQATAEIGYLIERLSSRYPLHGFGCKFKGLVVYGHNLASADSLAWSYNAYRHDPLPGHTHQTCSNCPEWAARWTERLADAIDARARVGWQESLFGGRPR